MYILREQWKVEVSYETALLLFSYNKRDRTVLARGPAKHSLIEPRGQGPDSMAVEPITQFGVLSSIHGRP